MLKEVSAGGVVIFGNAILLLKKFNGDWVLPKGRVKENEDIEEAALREVFEESGVKAEIVRYIGKVNYTYRSLINNQTIDKTVHWFLMKTNSMESVPQKREGFAEASFVHIDKSADMVRYDDEKKVIKKAIKLI
ncbi:MAG: NUDIX hydrolase [Tissierellia bacterium]|nr:NUDIX hydrolase [Tissierellia bacterium]